MFRKEEGKSSCRINKSLSVTVAELSSSSHKLEHKYRAPDLSVRCCDCTACAYAKLEHVKLILINILEPNMPSCMLTLNNQSNKQRPNRIHQLQTSHRLKYDFCLFCFWKNYSHYRAAQPLCIKNMSCVLFIKYRGQSCCCD